MRKTVPLLPLMVMIILMSLHSGLLLTAQDTSGGAVQFRFYPEEKFKIISRSDLRHHVNDAYKGLIAREVRGIFEREPHPRSDGGFTVEGRYYILEDLYRSSLGIARGLQEVQETAFTLYPDGRYGMAIPAPAPEGRRFSTSGEPLPAVPRSLSAAESVPYPLLRSFPRFPRDPVAPGESWIAESERILVTPGSSKTTRIPLLCEYTYTGTGQYQGETVDIIQAKYAVRYRRGEDPRGDRNLQQVTGSHDVTLYVGPKGPLFMRDNMFEDLQFVDGGSYREKGFILTFYKGIRGMDRTRVAENLKRRIEEGIEGENLTEEEKESIEVTEREEGVSLNLADLLFVPDQANLLPGEEAKLEAMARILKSIEDRNFLVVGHTAPFRDEAFRKKLSTDRAKAIVDALSARGIPAGRFLYEGRGAREQIAPNDTPENQRKNRRVEIIILED